MATIYLTTLGQDSHAFVAEEEGGPTLSPPGRQPEAKATTPLSAADRAEATETLPEAARAELAASTRPLMLGGVEIRDGTPALAGNSDADVILHAVTNAISGLSGVNILGGRADELCRQGICDSAVYLKEALATLPDRTGIVHVSVSLEGRRPRLKPYIEVIRRRLAELLSIRPDQVGLTATSGEALTAFGRGEGLQALCLVTFSREI